ncbi:MAG: hypothetical protein R3B13_16495 [Polyangiaceae bacterium]
MRSHLEFRSDAFPARPGEDDEVNPGRWGRSLADFLRAELNARGFTGGEPYAEDWGWAVPIDNPDYPLWVGCGNLDGEDDGFLCFVEPSKPFIRKLFRKIDVQARVESVAAAMEEALASREDVHDMRWWPED